MSRMRWERYIPQAVPTTEDADEFFAHAKDAKAAHRMWHQKDVKDRLLVEYPFPDEVYGVGKVRSLVYVSDKWERDGKMIDYMHDTDSRPTLYAGDGEGGAKRVASLLGTRDANDPIAFVHLAYLKWIEYDDNEGTQEHVFSRPVPLVCTRDKRTIVAIHRSRSLFINGGKMVVTSRGIVK